LAEIHAHEAAILADGAERFMQFRDDHPELAHRIIDVRYPDLIDDPVGTVRYILDRVQTPMTPQITHRVHNIALSRSRYGGVYPSDGSCEPALDRSLGLRFKQYCARFGVPFSESNLTSKEASVSRLPAQRNQEASTTVNSERATLIVPALPNAAINTGTIRVLRSVPQQEARDPSLVTPKNETL
jgi:hypothetical protein